MTPWQTYQQDLKRDDFVHDQAQENAVRHLQRLYDDLTNKKPQQQGFFAKLFNKSEPESIKGLYFWGGVGRGKTYLVDTFHDCLPFERKMRTHFHRFMQRVHSELTALEGKKNPLQSVANSLAAEASVICFDEFFVTDIADAMILGGLMEALFERGVTLVATSNIVPQMLYKNGLKGL